MINDATRMKNERPMMTTPRVPMDILLIEDKDEDISMVEDAIAETRMHNRMVVVRNHAEALQYLRQTAAAGPFDEKDEQCRPGLILLDINMREKQGFEVLHDIRSDPKLLTIPVVVLTDTLEENDLAYTISHGVTGYFLKPMDSAQLRKVVKDVEEHWSVLVNAPCAN
jgi:CheY-like chemotaxis protein